jgi:squalene synthase HpnC
LARSHYENFLVASVLLPRRLRQPFYNIYAFCRTADDLADESPSPAEALVRLERFQRELDESFRGKPRENLFIALMQTVGQFDLPKQPFDDLLDAFRQDQRQHRYRDFAELQSYCRRSANPVGRIVLHLGRCSDAVNAELSDQICTGLQLANFWQDVARDHAAGRIYLPQDVMRQHGVSEAMFSEPATPYPLRQSLKSECDRAEGFLRRGLALADRVPRWLSGDVRLFAHGGLATLAAIRRIDYDVLTRRPVVSKARQAWMVAKAAVGLL